MGARESHGVSRYCCAVIVALLLALGSTSCAASQPSGSTAPTTQARVATAAWRAPALSAAIRAAGQHILSERVTTVLASAPWVLTGLSIARGERLWVDTRSDGRWSGNPRLFPYADANGLPSYPGRYRVYAKAPVESLIGFVGSSPLTPPEVDVPVGSPGGGPGGISSPGFVEIGNVLLDYKPTTTGAIWLRNNDNTNYYSDVGRQIVRVIVTR